jgi:putative intracellular protease/amidase
MPSVLIPLPARDFDPTEAAVSWKVLSAAGHTVLFATPDGTRSYADDLMISGEGLDPWGFVPGLRKLKVLGAILRANADGRAAYAELERDAAFLAPVRHDALASVPFDGILLPGGHRARGMRPYLESDRLQALVVRAFDENKKVGAICHGVLLAARSISPATKRSVLHERRTTSLTWSQEHLAESLARVGRFWDGSYYRTYLEEPGEPCGYMGVEAEVTRALARPEDYRNVPQDAPDYSRKTDGRHRDTMEDARPAFVVRDGSYLSARWPGDVHTFAKTFAAMLHEA